MVAQHDLGECAFYAVRCQTFAGVLQFGPLRAVLAEQFGSRAIASVAIVQALADHASVVERNRG